MSGPQPANLDPIRAVLVRIRRREVLGRLLSLLSLSILVALTVFAVFLVAQRIFSFQADVGPPGALALALGAAVLVTAARAAWAVRVGLFDAAVLADDRLALKERLSSALYVEAHPDPIRDPSWARLIRRDGETSLAGIDIARSFPVRLPRSARWIPAPAVLAAVFAFIPPVDLFGFQKEREAESSLKEQVARKKDELRKAIEEMRKQAEKPPDPEFQKVLDALEKKPELKPTEKQEIAPGSEDAKKEALAQIARIEEALKKTMESGRFDDLKEFLDRFPPGTISKSPMTGEIREALKAGDFAKAALEMKKLEDVLSALLDKKKAGALSKEDEEKLRKLSEELARLAKDSKLLEKLGKSLDSARQNIDLKDLAKALDDLEKLGMDLKDLERLMKDLKFLEDAAELAKMTADDLGRLHKCPNCGKPSFDGSGMG